jgi:GPI ethanolamine phosphate transferase 1
VLTLDWFGSAVNDIDPNHGNSTSKQERSGFWKPNPRLVRPRYRS